MKVANLILSLQLVLLALPATADDMILDCITDNTIIIINDPENSYSLDMRLRYPELNTRSTGLRIRKLNSGEYIVRFVDPPTPANEKLADWARIVPSARLSNLKTSNRPETLDVESFTLSAPYFGTCKIDFAQNPYDMECLIDHGGDLRVRRNRKLLCQQYPVKELSENHQPTATGLIELQVPTGTRR